MNQKKVIFSGMSALIVMLIICVGQCLCSDEPDNQVVSHAQMQKRGESSRPISVNSSVVTPDSQTEYLKTNTNNVVVVNNTFLMPDKMIEMLSEKHSAMVTNVFVLPDGMLCRDSLKSKEDEEIAKKKAESDKRDAMSALFAINHINWVITKIKTYNDPAVLEEEYQGLMADALDLRVIKDPELIALIRRILHTIVELRIDEKEREMLKDELDQGLSDAFVDAVSGIGVSGLNPLQMAVSAVTSAVTAGMNYRKIKNKLRAQFKKQEWGLDKSKMRYLNDLNEEVLSSFWSIVQKYPDLPDKYRVSEQDIQMLVDHLKDEDAVKRHDYLVALEGRFSAFRPYWYHRASAAYEVACNIEKTIKDRKDSDSQDMPMDDSGESIEQKSAWRDAKVSLDKYLGWHQECGNILRRDSMVVKAAILKAAVLSHYSSIKDDDSEKLSVDPGQYKEIIKLVDENSSPLDWQSRYVCAVLAIEELKDVVFAKQVIAPAIAELDWQRRRRLVEWKEESYSRSEDSSSNSTNGISSVLETGDALCECKALFLRVRMNDKDLRDRTLAKICEDQNASVREKMFCYGASRYAAVLEKLRPDIAKMRVFMDKPDQYSVYLPFSWVITRDPSMALCIEDKRYHPCGKCSLKEHPDQDVGECVSIDFKSKDAKSNNSKVNKRDRTDNSLVNIEFQSSFKLSVPTNDNKSVTKTYMVQVEFKWKDGQWQPSKARFGEWKGKDWATAEEYDSLDF